MEKYTVYEVAEMLQTSHTTIYNKLNNKDIYKDMRNFIIKQGKQRYISKEGIEILKKYVPAKETLKEISIKTEPENTTINECISQQSIDNKTKETYEETLKEIDNKFIIEFKERIQSLENQLSVKDKQIESLLRQNENNQVLLKQHQEKILFLENPPIKGKTSFWSSIFKRG